MIFPEIVSFKKNTRGSNIFRCSLNKVSTWFLLNRINYHSNIKFTWNNPLLLDRQQSKRHLIHFGVFFCNHFHSDLPHKTIITNNEKSMFRPLKLEELPNGIDRDEYLFVVQIIAKS